MTTTLTEVRRGRSRPDSLGYQPALDGLRGLALVAIIVYHSEPSHPVWAPGAFLSVSTFFTLSGFLITALMLAEQQRNGFVSLRAFWARRLRRLMPAALAGIVVIVASAMLLGDSTQQGRLRADALSALGYVANWRFIAAGDAYGAAFESPSPFTHFWTLAIEEQFYVVLPLLVVGALVLGKGSRRAVGWALGGAAAVAVLWANWLVQSDASLNRLYFGTDVRSVELLSGALLAVWWMRRREPVGETGRRVVSVIAPLSVLAMLVLWFTADLEDLAFYRGGLAAYALLTLTAIVGSLQSGGLVRRVLAFKPLVWVGTVSYGAYLLHYPVLLWFDQHTSLHPALRLIIAVPVIFFLAELSARYIERPIRSGQLVRPPRSALIAIGSVALVFALVMGATKLVEPADTTDLEAAIALQRFQEQTAAQAESDAPRVGVFGDSAALMTSVGLSEMSRRHPDQYVADAGWADLGCGLLTEGSRRVAGTADPVPEHCQDWLGEWRRNSSERPAQIAAVQIGAWEVHEYQLVADGPFLVIGEDPEIDAEIERRLREGIDALLADNEVVILLNPPDIDMGRIDGRSPDEPAPESDPRRMERLREIMRDVAADHDRVRILDLAAWVESHPDERRLRPDGVHFTDTTTLEVAEWLGPELVRVYEEAKAELPPEAFEDAARG